MHLKIDDQTNKHVSSRKKRGGKKNEEYFERKKFCGRDKSIMERHGKIFHLFIRATRLVCLACNEFLASSSSVGPFSLHLPDTPYGICWRCMKRAVASVL